MAIVKENSEARRHANSSRTARKIPLNGTLFTRRTLTDMTNTQRFLRKIPPPTLRLFLYLSIISAIGIMALVLVTHSRS